MTPFRPVDAIEAAVAAAGRLSACAKSSRGVVIWTEQAGLLAFGGNRPPEPFTCSNDDACRASCNKICIHAEQNALEMLLESGAFRRAPPIHMTHIKVVDGKAVPSGPPSCWQCSRAILNCGWIDKIWLLHAGSSEDVHDLLIREGKGVGVWASPTADANGKMTYLRPYTALEFHLMTLEHCGLPTRTEPQ